MKTLLNTLFITTPRTYLHLDHETIKIEVDGAVIKQIPLHHINKIVIFGTYFVSPQLVERFIRDGKDIVFLTQFGRFAGTVVGPLSGNILLRRSQYLAYEDTPKKTIICKCFAAGKLQNSRLNLVRFARESDNPIAKSSILAAATKFVDLIRMLETANDIDEIRGIEGFAAKEYFSVFSLNIKNDDPAFTFRLRSRRPPLDPVNALLSFLYTLLRMDCHAALEAVGLDPQLGFMHALRPGRPALALDLMEEFRPIIVDRLVFTLINRKQLDGRDFTVQTGGATWLNDQGRKKVIIEYQKRKEIEFNHPYLKVKTPYGLIPMIQARLLARCLRGDIDFYPACVWR